MTIQNLAWLLLEDAYIDSETLTKLIGIVDHHYGEIKDVIALS